MLPDPATVIGVELALATAAFAYAGVARSSLSALKYEGARRAVEPLAVASLPAWRRLVGLAAPNVAVPVPIHPDRLARRGYNQAELLAAALCAGSGLRSVPLVSRARATEKMHRLDRAARLRNLVGAFDCPRPPPARIVLVDDIITTSATLEACATVLRRAGAREVYGFAIAREI